MRMQVTRSLFMTVRFAKVSDVTRHMRLHKSDFTANLAKVCWGNLYMSLQQIMPT